MVCNFPRFSGEIWLPFLWAQAKTYYELYGERCDEWQWFPCHADVYSAEYKDKIKELLQEVEPDIFAISLYVWNYSLAHEIAAWVKGRWPRCLVISGGPHQYLKHDANWFRYHPHLDASLPGDCYGELCFKQILDNYDDETATVDWNKVTDIYYPSKSRFSIANRVSMTRTERKDYQFDWSSFSAQKDHLLEFARYQRQEFPSSMLLSVLETTRGCPYGCTYCDWGGGTLTTVLQKSSDTVKQDIDALMDFGITYLFLADANFGIFGQRDVEIIRYLAQRKEETQQPFGVGYGGFAKTANKLEFIRDILNIDLDNNLSMTQELKLSMQTLDDVVLDNIDRKNIDLDRQLEVYQPLARHRKLPLYVEMILGLPGITLEKYYYELDVLGRNQLNVQWFEWILLPETPAYATQYRDKYGLETIIKQKGWTVKEESSEREVVVGCKTYTTSHYLQMLLSTSLYHLMVQGGWYRNSVDLILKTHNIGHGELCRDIYENYIMADPECSHLRLEIETRWNTILTNPWVACEFDVDGHEVYGGWYFIALCFLRPQFGEQMVRWAAKKYLGSLDSVAAEKDLQIHCENFGRTRLKGWYMLDHTKEIHLGSTDLDALIGAYRHYLDSGRLMRGKKKLMGLITVQD